MSMVTASIVGYEGGAKNYPSLKPKKAKGKRMQSTKNNTVVEQIARRYFSLLKKSNKTLNEGLISNVPISTEELYYGDNYNPHLWNFGKSREMSIKNPFMHVKMHLPPEFLTRYAQFYPEFVLASAEKLRYNQDATDSKMYEQLRKRIEKLVSDDELMYFLSKYHVKDNPDFISKYAANDVLKASDKKEKSPKKK